MAASAASETVKSTTHALKGLSLCQRAPYFVILGAQKCGTTAMYDYICQHPSIARARRKEPQFFAWNWKEMMRVKIPPKFDALTKAIVAQDEHSSSMSDFERDMRRKYLLVFPLEAMGGLDTTIRKQTPQLPTAQQHPKLAANSPRLPMATGEASPSYLIYGEVAERMKRIAPHAKFVILARNPVDRAFSHYNMTCDPVGSPFVKRIRGTHILGDRTFQEVVEEDIKNLTACHATCGLHLPVANRCMEPYMRNLPEGHGAHCYVGRGLYAMQLKHWLRYFDRSQFLVLSTERLKTAQGCQQQMDRVFAFLGLPRYVLPDTTPKNTAKQRGRKSQAMADGMRRKLEKFFRPHNEEFFKLIGEDFGWNAQD